MTQTIHELSGHIDYSFASAWNPNGFTFATGNQDKTCRVWDIRNLSKSAAVLRGNLGAIRSIRFTSDGRFMAMAEPADFVHVFDVTSEYEKKQELDFFGEISGISFSPDTESLFVGVWDRTYGSLLQYRRRRVYTYLDSMFWKKLLKVKLLQLRRLLLLPIGSHLYDIFVGVMKAFISINKKWRTPVKMYKRKEQVVQFAKFIMELNFRLPSED